MCPGFDGCGEVDFPSAGRFILTLTLIFEDGSALCDNILVLVTTCSPTGRLDVIPTPKLPVYDPSDPSRSIVDLTVRLRNISQPKNGLPACNFLLRGANVLTCKAAIKVGSAKDTASTSFDLPHCSETTDQSCSIDAECSCERCKPGEICLTQEERARQPREDHRYVDGERVDPEYKRLEKAQVLDPRTAQLFFGTVAPAGYSNTPTFASRANSSTPIPRSSRSTCSVCSPSRGAAE